MPCRLPRRRNLAGRPLATESWTDEPGRGLKDIARQAARTAERAVLKEVLEQVRWNRRVAARRLKISYKALLHKIRLFGLG